MKEGILNMKIQREYNFSSINKKVTIIFDDEKDKERIKQHIELYPHQPKKAYAITLEHLPIKISYDTFKRFLKKHCI